MHPAHNELGNFLAFPLWCQMTSTMNSSEVEAFVADLETGYLTVGVPGSPGLLDGPVKHLNPSAGAISGDGTIGISRVEEDLVAVLLEDFVYPEGSFELISVVHVNVIVALLPSLNVVWNVNGPSNVLTVSIV